MDSTPKPRSRIANALVWIAAVAVCLALYVRLGRNEFGTIRQNLRLLETGEANERGYALGQLALESGADPDRVLPAIIGATADEDGYVRSQVATALGAIHLPPPWDLKACEALIPLLEDRDGRVIAASATTLGKLRGAPKTVVPALIRAAGIGVEGEADKGEDVQAQGLAFDPISPTWKVAASYDAFRALGSYAGPESPEACSAILAQARHPDPRFRVVVVESIGRSMLDREEALKGVLGMAEDEDPLVLEAVIPVLGWVASSDEHAGRLALEALIMLTRSNHELIRSEPYKEPIRGQAIVALGAIIESNTEVSRPAFDALVQLTSSSDLIVGTKAIEALGNAGQYLPEALLVLERAIGSRPLSFAAAHALDKIAGEGAAGLIDPIEAIRSDRAVQRYLAANFLDRSKPDELNASVKASRDPIERIQAVVSDVMLNGRRTSIGSSSGLSRKPLALPQVVKILGDTSTPIETRRFLLQLLSSEVQQGNKEAWEGICLAALDPDVEVRKIAVTQMSPARFPGSGSAEFRDVEKALYHAAVDQDPTVRAAAESALERFAQMNLIPNSFDAARALGSAEPGERFLGVLLLDPKNSKDAELLVAAIRDPNPSIRRRALLALPKIEGAGSNADEVRDSLASAIKDDDPGVRDAASQAKKAVESEAGKRTEN